MFASGCNQINKHFSKSILVNKIKEIYIQKANNFILSESVIIFTKDPTKNFKDIVKKLVIKDV